MTSDSTTDASTPPATAPEYMAVYKAFTANYGSNARVVSVEQAEALPGPLVVVGGATYSVFLGDGSNETQAFRVSVMGFEEITAISHIGPSMGFLADLVSKGVTLTGPEKNPGTLEGFVAAVESVKTLNASDDSRNWLNNIDASSAPVYFYFKDQVQRLINHACGLTLNYLEKHLGGESEYDFSYPSLQARFFNDRGDGTPGFNQVMITTFSLVALTSVMNAVESPTLQSVDWANALIMFNGMSGGIGAGVNAGTNGLTAILQAVAGDTDISDKILFAPYSQPSYDSVTNMAEGADKDAAMQQLETAYRNQYFTIAARVEVANKMFDDSIARQPQTYPSWTEGPASMEELISRLKTVMGDPRQLLSNSVGSAIAAAFVAAGRDYTKVSVPGLDGYPAL